MEMGLKHKRIKGFFVLEWLWLLDWESLANLGWVLNIFWEHNANMGKMIPHLTIETLKNHAPQGGMCAHVWAALYLCSPYTRVPPPAPRVSRPPFCNIVKYRQNSQCVLFIIWEWLLLMQNRLIRIVGIKMPLKFRIDCCNISMVALFQVRNADWYMIDTKPWFVDFWESWCVWIFWL